MSCKNKVISINNKEHDNEKLCDYIFKLEDQIKY